MTPVDGNAVQTFVASLVGGGGGAWMAIKLAIHFLEKRIDDAMQGVEDAKGIAWRAHDRLNAIDGRRRG